MSDSFEMQVIARIRSDFGSKFGVPRQSGLVDALEAAVVFEPPYRNPDALRGLEGFSHIWLIWAFHQSQRPEWSPTVRPPRLGEAISGWESLPAAPPSGPIPSASPPCGWTTSRTRTPWARCSMSVAQTW